MGLLRIKAFALYGFPTVRSIIELFDNLISSMNSAHFIGTDRAVLTHASNTHLSVLTSVVVVAHYVHIQ